MPAQHRGLGQVQVLHVLGEVLLGRGLHPIGPVTQEDVIEVEVEDLFFAEIVVDAIGQDRFPDLAGKALFRGEEDALHHLLSDGAAALDHLARLQIAEKGPDDAGDIHPRVLEKPGVLRGHKGQDQVPGQAAVWHFDAAFVIELADVLAVPGEDFGHHRGPELLDGFEIRQVAQEMVIDVARSPGGPQKGGEEQAVEHPGQALGPAPPPMVMLHPVGVRFEDVHLSLCKV